MLPSSRFSMHPAVNEWEDLMWRVERNVKDDNPADLLIPYQRLQLFEKIVVSLYVALPVSTAAATTWVCETTVTTSICLYYTTITNIFVSNKEMAGSTSL